MEEWIVINNKVVYLNLTYKLKGSKGGGEDLRKAGDTDLL